jgi:RNA polymerase sigma factor (sigma-70 family)
MIPDPTSSAAAIQTRDGALSHVIRTEGKKLSVFIRRRVSNADDADDILQDVFTQLAASYSITEPIEHLTAWLFTVARHRIIDWYRRRKPERGVTSGDSNEDDVSLTDFLLATGAEPDELYARSEFWEILTEALGKLPPEQRDVFVMHEVEGRSFKEIAAQTGVPINTLLSRKRYAMLRLRDELFDYLQDD